MAIETSLPPYDLSKVPAKTGDQTNEEFMENADYFVDYITTNIPTLESMRAEANILANDCNNAALTILAGTNFKGVWSNLSGAYDVGSSVYWPVGDVKYWMLAANTYVIEAHTPGTDGIFKAITIPLSTVNTLATYTPSGAAVVDITSVITSVYPMYEIRLQNVIPASDNVQFFVRSSSNNGVTYDALGTDYYYHLTSSSIISGNSGSFNPLGGAAVGSDANEYGVTGSMWLYNPSNTLAYKEMETNLSCTTSTGLFVEYPGFCRRLSTAIIDSLRISFSSGNIESGTIIVRGHR